MIDRHALGQLLAPSDTVVSIYLPLGGAEPPAPSALANGTAATGAQGLARCPARQLPLPRLLRLSLFQVSVGMALALLISALGRFAVIGTGVLPSWLIPLAIALPLFILPLRTVLCSHYYARGSDDAWQRVPYILAGTLLQFMGLAVMPFGLGLLSVTSATPALIGQASTLFAFILVAGGLHMVQAFGFRLATDLAPEDAHPRVVIVWFAMLLAGLAVSFLAFAALLANASGFALIQVIQSAAVLTMVVNAAALWRQVDYDRIAQSMQGSLLQAALHETEQSLAQRGVARPDIDALLYRARSLAIITAAARDHDRGLALFLRNWPQRRRHAAGCAPCPGCRRNLLLHRPAAESGGGKAALLRSGDWQGHHAAVCRDAIRLSGDQAARPAFGPGRARCGAIRCDSWSDSGRGKL